MEESKFLFHPPKHERIKLNFYKQLALEWELNGYISPINYCCRDEITRIRSCYDEEIKNLRSTPSRLIHAHNKFQFVHNIATDARITDIVSSLIGENIMCWGSTFLCKFPYTQETVAWHQDSVYWDWHESRCATVWLAIDDASATNGSMKVIPKSHKFGKVEHKPSHSSENNILNQTAQAIDAYGEERQLNLKAGQFSIHSDLILHGSSSNKSAERRCGLVLRYAPTQLRSLTWSNSWPVKDAIIAKGIKDSNYWGNPLKPQTQESSPVKNSQEDLIRKINAVISDEKFSNYWNPSVGYLYKFFNINHWVISPPKAGTSHIFQSILQSGEDCLHLHNDYNTRKWGHPNSPLENSGITLLDLLEYRKLVNNNNLNIYCGVRDPISWCMSLYAEIFRDAKEEEILNIMQNIRMEEIKKHKPGSTFKIINEYMGFNIFKSYPFDKEKGWSLIQTENVNIYLYRLDSLDLLMNELNLTLGIRTSSHKRKNTSIHYRNAVKKARFSKQDVEFFMSFKYVNKFFTPSQVAHYKHLYTS